MEVGIELIPALVIIGAAVLTFHYWFPLVWERFDLVMNNVISQSTFHTRQRCCYSQSHSQSDSRFWAIFYLSARRVGQNKHRYKKRFKPSLAGRLTDFR